MQWTIWILKSKTTWKALRYRGNLGVRARDGITQIHALQALQSHAEQSEFQVISTRKMMSNLTSTALLSVPGYAAAVVDMNGATGSTPALKSQAEATIQQNTSIKDSAWKKGNCLGCNRPVCQWLKNDDVVCPNRDRPGSGSVPSSTTMYSKITRRK